MSIVDKSIIDLYTLFRVDLNRRSTYELIKEMVDQGFSERMIAKKADISRTQVWNILNEKDNHKKYPCHPKIINVHSALKKEGGVNEK